jgi:hypothetical protein
MKSIVRWGIWIEGDISRLAGSMEMTYLWTYRKDAETYAERTGVGIVVKVTLDIEG